MVDLTEDLPPVDPTEELPPDHSIVIRDGVEVILPDHEIWGEMPTQAEIIADRRASMLPISHFQFASVLTMAGIITKQEARDYVGGNALPQIVMDVINNHPTWTDGEKMVAELRIVGTASIERASDYIAILAAAPGINLDDEQIDNLFLMAAGI